MTDQYPDPIPAERDPEVEEDADHFVDPELLELHEVLEWSEAVATVERNVAAVDALESGS